MKMGVTPITKAAAPEGTVCSAQVTRPFPPSRRKEPAMACSRHWDRVGRFSPRHHRRGSRMALAITKRVPAMSNGGIDATATRIAR